MVLQASFHDDVAGLRGDAPARHPGEHFDEFEREDFEVSRSIRRFEGTKSATTGETT